MRRGGELFVVVAVCTLSACRGESSAPPAPAPSAPPPIAAASMPALGERSPTHVSGTPEHALDAMDARTPVPLLPMMALHQKQNMRDHLEAVREIVAAAGTSDFAGIQTAARRIAYSEQMGRMCQHMGSGAPGFTERALAFHHTADGIGEAAGRRDLQGVLQALGATLATCTGCHALYKQKLVPELTHAPEGR